MTLEDMLAHITSFGWYTRLIEVSGASPDSAWHKGSCCFRLPDGTVAPRIWYADLHHGSAVKKSGYGPTALAALKAAWNADEVERQSLYLRHPDDEPAPTVDLSTLGIVKQRPVLRRI